MYQYILEHFFFKYGHQNFKKTTPLCTETPRENFSKALCSGHAVYRWSLGVMVMSSACHIGACRWRFKHWAPIGLWCFCSYPTFTRVPSIYRVSYVSATQIRHRYNTLGRIMSRGVCWPSFGNSSMQQLNDKDKSPFMFFFLNLEISISFPCYICVCSFVHVCCCVRKYIHLSFSGLKSYFPLILTLFTYTIYYYSQVYFKASISVAVYPGTCYERVDSRCSRTNYSFYYDGYLRSQVNNTTNTIYIELMLV